jgi:AcrR family transcriptional regulator
MSGRAIKRKAVKKHDQSGKGAELPAEITIEDLRNSSAGGKANATFLKIVLTALKLFHTNGYGPTTTRDIGRACKITAGGHLYYYIKSKEDFPRIFVEIAEKDLVWWEESVRKDMEHLPPDELLEIVIRDYAYSIHTRRKILAFWYHAAVQVRREDVLGIRDIEVRAGRLFQEIIERGNETGHFHVSDPYLLAINIVMMCQTWALKRWLIRDKRTIDQYVDRIVEFVMVIVRGSPQHNSKLNINGQNNNRLPEK